VAVLATDRRKLIEPIHAHYKDRGLGRLSARGLIKPKRWRSGMRSPTISWSAIGSGRRPRPPRAEITRRATATTPSTPPDLPNASIHPSPAKARILHTLESGGLDVLRREQAHAVAQRPQRAPSDAAAARFQRHLERRQHFKEAQQVTAAADCAAIPHGRRRQPHAA
jgi:hypothetical protein